MLNVFITCDTEVWPTTPDWRQTQLRADMRRDIYGETPQGSFGLPFQLDVLNRHGLHGVFFVEPLFADVVGLEPLREIVDLVQNARQEVQLHLHTEWLTWNQPEDQARQTDVESNSTASIATTVASATRALPIAAGRTGQNIKEFSLEEQTQLLQRGIDNLREAGAINVRAFRAGNYGANFDTLGALAAIGLEFDTSHNTCYLERECGMDTGDLVLGPRKMHGIWELPVSFFRDYPGHFRHTQLVACSSQELETVLWRAWQQKWYSLVIVTHSFELIKRQGRPRHDPIVVRRFERLCRFLAQHRDKFRTRGFADLDASEFPAQLPAVPLKSPLRHTAWRVVSQVVRRFL